MTNSMMKKMTDIAYPTRCTTRQAKANQERKFYLHHRVLVSAINFITYHRLHYRFLISNTDCIAGSLLVPTTTKQGPCKYH